MTADPRPNQPIHMPDSLALARRYGGKSRAVRAQERRQRFIEAAVQLFGSKGHEATTIREICREAKLTERYFYESFASSDEILCAAYLHVSVKLRDDIVMAGLAARKPGLPGPQSAQVKAALSAYFSGLDKDRAGARLLLFEMEGASSSLKSLYLQEIKSWSEQIKAVNFPSADAGQDGLSGDLLATGLLGAVYGIARLWAVSGFRTPKDRLVRNCLAIFKGAQLQWRGAI